MYHAKRGGKNQYRIYVDEMGQESSSLSRSRRKEDKERAVP